jgi:hypothetical protein
MKRPQMLLSHGAVFAVGIAAAMITNSHPSNGRGAEVGGETRVSPRAAQRLQASEESGAGGRRSDNARANGQGSRIESPIARIEEISKNSDAFERQRALMDLIDRLGPDQFAGVADRFRELDHLGDTRGEYALLLRGWAKADPTGALAYVEEHGGRGRDTILETWAGTDASAAEHWALENHSGDGPNPYLASVIGGIAANDLAHASRLIESMPDGRERGSAVAAITRALLVQGVDAALAYPASIADETLRGNFVREIANRLSGKDPVSAANWLASMDEGAIQKGAARTVANALARSDAAQAATWVAKLEPEARAEAARGVIPVMASNDIAGTARWVSTLVGTPGYDRVVEEFVMSCDERAPVQSAIWIKGISDPARQREVYQRMLSGWAQRDRAAMREWVAANDVPADIRRRFLR